MRGSKDDLTTTMESMGVVIREAEWGTMNVSVESFPAGTDPAPLFRGLPDDLCQCPHWGYIVRGRVQVRYKDHEETMTGGDAYYLAPGHVCRFDEDSEIVEFSPKGEYQKTLEVIAGNLAALQAASA